MNYDEGFKIIQLHFNEIEALPEDHARYGDAICAVHDYVKLLEGGLERLKGELEKTKKALRDTADGRPSEWAYVQLKNDYDKSVAITEEQWREIADREMQIERLKGERDNAYETLGIKAKEWAHETAQLRERVLELEEKLDEYELGSRGFP